MSLISHHYPLKLADILFKYPYNDKNFIFKDRESHMAYQDLPDNAQLKINQLLMTDRFQEAKVLYQQYHALYQINTQSLDTNC